MEPRDYENLRFILSHTPDQLLEWWNSIDGEDQLYAIELMRQYQQELSRNTGAINKIAGIKIKSDEDVDVGEAAEYLKKFRLTK